MVRGTWKSARKRRKPRGMTKARVLEIVSEHAETKFKDTAINDSSSFSGSSEWFLLSGIAEGAGDDERIGTDVDITSVQIQGHILDDLDQATINTVVRIVLVKWNEDSEHLPPVVTDLFVTDSIHGLRNVDKINNFKVIKNYKKALPKSSNVTMQTLNTFKFYKRFKTPIRVSFDDDTDAVGSTVSNHLWLLLMSTGADTEGALFALNTRINFKDI